MSGSGWRPLLQVEPAGLVGLAATSESILASMDRDWTEALDDLAGACGALGDATGTLGVASSYADVLSDAGEVVAAVAGTLGLGVSGLIDAAHDAARADDEVAVELHRTAHRLGDGVGLAPGRGGR